MDLNIKLDNNAFLPSKAYTTDAGFDLKSPFDCIVKKHDNIVINTGVHVQLPPGYAAVAVSKSGLNFKNDIVSTGLIDEGYTGPIMIKLYNHGNNDYEIKRGDKISQIVIIKNYEFNVKQIENINEGIRGEKGFGSSGK